MNAAYISGPGEPNKLCDLIAAGISEEYQKRDAAAETEIHVSGGNGALFVAGKVRSTADFDVATLVKQILGGIDPGLSLEPFIAIESTPIIKRPPLHVVGYATGATPTMLPPVVDLGMGIARQLEDARKGDEGWFWLSPDFDVSMIERDKKRVALVRVSHVDSISTEDVRDQVTKRLEGRIDEVRVNSYGADTGNGLSSGIGASGQSSSEWYGGVIPAPMNASGSELAHPANIGWMAARHVAKQLVRQNLGKAIMVDLIWEPLEDNPTIARARNERGADFSKHIDASLISKKKLVDKWGSFRMGSNAKKFSFDGAIDLPFENDDLLQ